MRHLKEILAEAKKLGDEEEKEKELVFVETDPQEPFPHNTIAALKKDIRNKAKDLTIDWKSSVELLDSVFTDLDVPKPGAFLSKRWAQYRELLDDTIQALTNARGLKASWTRT